MMPPTKRPPGRPTKLTPDVVKVITEAVERGNTLKNAAALGGIDEATFHRWMEKGRNATSGPYCDFCQSIGQALAASQDRAVKSFVKAFDDDWRAAQEYLARRHPEDWAKKDNLKVEAQHSGEIVVKVRRIDSDGNTVN